MSESQSCSSPWRRVARRSWLCRSRRVPAVNQTPLVVAHRGASHDAPENTLAAFGLAISMGADGIELDVHRTADHVLVVHHDAELAGIGLVMEHTHAELIAARPEVPTLDEVFDLCSGMALVNVEMKCCAWDVDADPDRIVARAVAQLIDRRHAHHNVVVSSFDLAMLDDLRAIDSSIATGWLIHGHDPAAAVAVAREHGHDNLHPDWGNLDARLDATMLVAREHGVRINTWTVDDPEKLREFAAAGVHAVITNRPDVARRALD